MSKCWSNKMKAAKPELIEWIHQSRNPISQTNIYIMEFNILCSTGDEYIPNEVGIVKYSICLGIIDTFHSFIDPGMVPIGYASVSKERSESTHNIPVSNFKLSSKNYTRILSDIKSFVTPEDEVKCRVFSRSNELIQNKGCLRWLSNRAKFCNVECIEFFDLTDILSELIKLSDSTHLLLNVIGEMLYKHSFDYAPDTLCDFHEKLDNPHCALGYAKRSCYVISENLCELFHVEPTRNHLPPNNGKTNFKTHSLQLRNLPRFWSHRNEITRLNNENNSKDTDLLEIASNSLQETNHKSPKQGGYVHSYHATMWKPLNLNKQHSNDISDNAAISQPPVSNNDMRQPFTIPVVLQKRNHSLPGTFDSDIRQPNNLPFVLLKQIYNNYPKQVT